MSCLVCLHIRFQVLEEENGPWTVPIVTAIALGPIGLFPVLHHIGTVTIGTLHLHKSHSTSPTRNCDICAQSYQAINSPFAPLGSDFLNFKLLIESGPQSQ